MSDQSNAYADRALEGQPNLGSATGVAPPAPCSALLAAERRCTDLEHVEDSDRFEEETHMLALWYELKKLRMICRRALAYGLNGAKSYDAHEACEVGAEMRKALNEPNAQLSHSGADKPKDTK